MKAHRHGRGPSYLLGTGRLVAAAALVAGIGVASMSACRLAVATEEQCESNAICVSRLGASATCVDNVCQVPVVEAGPGLDAGDSGPVDPQWGCLGNVPPVYAEPSIPARYLGRFHSFTNQALAGLSFNVCKQFDVDCATPLPGSPVVSQADGLLDITLTSGFRATLQMQPAASLLPAIIYLYPIPDKNASLGDPSASNPKYPVTLPTEPELGAFTAGRVAGGVNPESGHVLFRVVDCQRELAADITVQAETVATDTGIVYAGAGGTSEPVLSLTKTSSSGLGVYLNLTPGPSQLDVKRSDGTLIARQSIFIRKGAITHIVLGPMP